MLVNESTLRTAVRKHLLEAYTFDSLVSDTAAPVAAATAAGMTWAANPLLAPAAGAMAGLGTMLPDALTSKTAWKNFMDFDPTVTSNSPNSMRFNRNVDGEFDPKKSVFYLYSYVNEYNVGSVYSAIIKILSNHANDLNVDAGEVEQLYGKALMRSLSNASKSMFAPAQPLPQSLAKLTGLPVNPDNNEVTPAGAATLTAASAATPTAASAATPTAASAASTATSLSDSLNALITLLKEVGTNIDDEKLTVAKEQAKNDSIPTDSIASSLVDACDINGDNNKLQLRKFATAYLNTCRHLGIFNTNAWASSYLQNAKLSLCIQRIVDTLKGKSLLQKDYVIPDINRYKLQDWKNEILNALIDNNQLITNKPAFRQWAETYLQQCGVDLSGSNTSQNQPAITVNSPAQTAAKKPTGPRLPNKQLVQLLRAEPNWNSINQKWTQLLSNYVIYTAGPPAEDITNLVKTNWANAAGLISSVRRNSDQLIVFRDETGRGFTPDQNGMINFINSLQPNGFQNYAPVAKRAQSAATVSPGAPAPPASAATTAPTPAPQKQSPKNLFGKLRNKINAKKSK